MTKVKNDYIKIFLISFLAMMVILIPDIIKNGGIFAYGGDYAYQQIPFYIHSADLIKSGQIGWDWCTDLGSDFVGSYSFYLLGSIFFWIAAILPGKFIVYAMPVLIALKSAMAAETSYIYIKRYVKNNIYASMAAFMYAFSGFQLFNLVYNHFHDVTALFPLLLLSFDLLVTENKKGFFCFMVAVMALTNYFFFVGQVVFILIYYVIRCVKGDFRFRLSGLGIIVTEGLIGVSMAGVLLLPSFISVTGVDRAGNILTDVDLLSYSDNTIIPKIIQSLFIIPDYPSYSQLFQSKNNPNNWASISLYLPLFASVGVYTYIKKDRKDSISTLLLLSLFMACIPVLNSAFYMFNSAYYARWFYMPVLFMCIATARCLERKYDFLCGIKFQGVGVVTLALISLLPSRKTVNVGVENAFKNVKPETEVKWFCMSDIPVVFWQNIAFGMIFLIIIYIYLYERKKERDINKKIFAVLLGFIIVNNIIYMNNSVDNLNLSNYKEQIIEFNPEFDDDGFYRLNMLHDNNINANMIWKEKTINQFHSIVSEGAEKFYREVQGKDRMMRSLYEENDYPVYGLLSVKYVLNKSTGDDLNVENYPVDLKGFSLYDKQGYYYIYKNDNFVPMGNIYDYCISDENIEEFLDDLELSEEERYNYKKMIMMRALVLSEDDIEKYSDLITEIPEEMLENLNEETYFSDCAERAELSCSAFEYDSNGFKAKIKTDKPGIIYFSVPLSKGWSATVNDEKTDISDANYGLMALKVNPGENIIECSYKTPGLETGIYISFAGLIIYAIYLVFAKKISCLPGKE